MISLLAFVALVAIAALTGAQFEPGAWYAALAKPSWTPPSWLFAPVWTLLYVAIAVAGWLVCAPTSGPSIRAIWTRKDSSPPGGSRCRRRRSSVRDCRA